MDIRRHEKVGNHSVEEMVSYCLEKLEEDGFSEGIDWDTEISEHLTVEEMIGALVRSEAEFIDEYDPETGKWNYE